MTNKGSNSFVRFASKNESETELLSPDSAFAQALASLTPESQSKILEGLDLILQEASDVEVNIPIGEPKVRAGNWHIRLRFSFWEAVKTTGSLVITALKLTAGGDAKDIVGAALTTIDEIVKRISRLKPEELMVYEAAVDVIHASWDKTLKIPGASAPDLDKLFNKRGVLFPVTKIRTILADLSSDKRQVLRVEEQSENEDYYVPVF